MPIELDHVIVSARDQRASAERLAGLLGVPWSESGVGPFSPVYVNAGLTLDFIDDSSSEFPVQHFCFRVDDQTFDAILRRLKAAGIKYRSSVHGPVEMQVNTSTAARSSIGANLMAMRGKSLPSVMRGDPKAPMRAMTPNFSLEQTSKLVARPKLSSFRQKH